MRARMRLMFISTVQLEAPRQLAPDRRTSSWRLTGTPEDCARLLAAGIPEAAGLSAHPSPGSRSSWCPAKGLQPLGSAGSQRSGGRTIFLVAAERTENAM